MNVRVCPERLPASSFTVSHLGQCRAQVSARMAPARVVNDESITWVSLATMFHLCQVHGHSCDSQYECIIVVRLCLCSGPQHLCVMQGSLTTDS